MVINKKIGKDKVKQNIDNILRITWELQLPDISHYTTGCQI